jgi:2,3-bisphosphoglycerate-independent phosphoglycerate mutase
MTSAAGTAARPAAKRPKPFVLCILDGWGHRAEKTDNALAQAKLPTWNRWMTTVPHALVETSGRAVGLPDGQMGNSEVGHMNIGAGRVMTQDLPRIDAAIEDGSFAKAAALQSLIGALKKSGGACHVMGLISPGGVHSHQDQIAALVRVLDSAGISVRVHAFLDGRDTPPQSAVGFLADFAAKIAPFKRASIATVSGRYYAMDRDKRWDRVEKAYLAMVDAKGEHAPSPAAAVAQSYGKKVTDEFMVPAVIGDYIGMKDGDGVMMGNFRADRAREILTALLDGTFAGFTRSRVVKFAAAAGLVEYSAARRRNSPARRAS